MVFEELKPEEKLEKANQIYSLLIKKFAEEVEKKYGEEGRELLNKAFHEVGIEFGKELKKKLGIEGKEPKDYALLHYYQDVNVWGLKEKIKVLENGDALIQVYYCPVKDIYRGRDCARYVPYVRGLMDSVNPNLKWKVNKVLTKGADCCEFIVTKD
ncbi:hypothetical protein DRO26_00850 [Candidatus Bathyarchaeota archaeon]|nr:MAG: hypothetical protein DRO26_00850 [Candidatus Bathyarchaeota archaeon]